MLERTDVKLVTPHFPSDKNIKTYCLTIDDSGAYGREAGDAPLSERAGGFGGGGLPVGHSGVELNAGRMSRRRTLLAVARHRAGPRTEAAAGGGWCYR